MFLNAININPDQLIFNKGCSPEIEKKSLLLFLNRHTLKINLS